MLPALIYQYAWVLSADLFEVLPVAPIALWVLLGGRSVVAVFEATARDLTGHRHSTMLDNAQVFLAMTALQCAVFVAILARRDKAHPRDPVAVVIGAAFLANAALAARWPWWGT